MIHALKIEAAAAAPGEPVPPTQTVQLAAITTQITQEMTRLEGVRGGVALPKQRQSPLTVAPKRGLPTRVVALHLVEGDRATVVAAGVAAVQGAAWFRVWHHVCRNQERKPCQPWTLVASSERGV